MSEEMRRCSRIAKQVTIWKNLDVACMNLLSPYWPEKAKEKSKKSKSYRSVTAEIRTGYYLQNTSCARYCSSVLIPLLEPGLVGFGFCPSSGNLKNTTFWKLDLFPSTGECVGDTYSVGFVVS
jgi:hypothetical protein